MLTCGECSRWRGETLSCGWHGRRVCCWHERQACDQFRPLHSEPRSDPSDPDECVCFKRDEPEEHADETVDSLDGGEPDLEYMIAPCLVRDDPYRILEQYGEAFRALAK